MNLLNTCSSVWTALLKTLVLVKELYWILIIRQVMSLYWFIVYRQFTERKIVHERHCLTLLNTLPCSNSRVEFVCYIQLRELSKNSINHLSANPTKRSNTLKQFVGKNLQIVWLCLIILWGWRIKG